MTHPVALIVNLLMFVGTLQAQQPGGPPEGLGPCGPLDAETRQLRLEQYAEVFTGTDEDAAELRASLGLAFVSPDDPAAVVSEPRECGPIVAEAFRVLNKQILAGPPPATHASTEWVVLRVGPYLIIPMDSRPVDGVTVQGYAQVLIFTLSDRRFVGWFLG